MPPSAPATSRRRLSAQWWRGGGDYRVAAAARQDDERLRRSPGLGQRAAVVELFIYSGPRAVAHRPDPPRGGPRAAAQLHAGRDDARQLQALELHVRAACDGEHAAQVLRICGLRASPIPQSPARRPAAVCRRFQCSPPFHMMSTMVRRQLCGLKHLSRLTSAASSARGRLLREFGLAHHARAPSAQARRSAASCASQLFERRRRASTTMHRLHEPQPRSPASASVKHPNSPPRIESTPPWDIPFRTCYPVQWSDADVVVSASFAPPIWRGTAASHFTHGLESPAARDESPPRFRPASGAGL